MTKKHYVALSQILKYARPNASGSAPQHDKDVAHEVIDQISHKLADYLQAERSAFDRARFLKACGVSEVSNEKI